MHVGDRTSARDLYYEKVLHNEQNHLGWVGEQAFSKKGPKAESSETFKYLVVNFFVFYYLKDHYDWGLRAIKSVLVVAGSLKRSDRERPEDQVLMRALRDFNIPKIVTDDVPVFMGLIGDLFPALDVPRKRDMDFEALVKKSALVRLEFVVVLKRPM